MGILSQRRHQMLLTAWAAWVVNYLDRTKTAASLPLIVASLGMTKQQTGWVMFTFFAGYAAVQPVAGFTTDKSWADVLEVSIFGNEVIGSRCWSGLIESANCFLAG